MYHDLFPSKLYISCATTIVKTIIAIQSAAAYNVEPNCKGEAYHSMQPMITRPKHGDPAKRERGASRFTRQ